MRKDGYGVGEAEAPPLPPHSIIAEQELLGALLAQPNTWPQVVRLKPEHFFEGLHARIFEAIMEMATAGKPISAMVLHARFKDDATLAEIGGTAVSRPPHRRCSAANQPSSIMRTIFENWQRAAWSSALAGKPNSELLRSQA